MSRKRAHKQEKNDQEFPKRLFTQPSTTEVDLNFFCCLPFNVIGHIFKKFNISELRKLGMVSKRCQDLVLSWLEKDTGISIFPALISDVKPYSVKYQISGSSKLYALNPKMARENFYQLGLMMKQLTCLRPTNQKMEISGKLLSCVSIHDKSSPNCEFMNLCGIFLHSFVKGWEIDDCQLASVTLIKAFNSNGAISAILDQNYIMGSDPLLEINTHSFLFSIFWRDVKQRKIWLLFLLNFVTPDLCPNKLARIMLLQFSLPRNHSSLLGPDLAWEDNLEAVPATMEVAISRYQHLVSGLIMLQGHIPLPQVLRQIFITPEKWIPENIGSVLLLCGPLITKEFLLYQVRESGLLF